MQYPSAKHEMKMHRCHKAIVKFGIVPILYLLAGYEELERYEDCAVIRDAILEENEVYNNDLPLTLRGLDIKSFVNKAFGVFGIIPQNYWLNLNYYIDETERILDEIAI